MATFNINVSSLDASYCLLPGRSNNHNNNNKTGGITHSLPSSYGTEAMMMPKGGSRKKKTPDGTLGSPGTTIAVQSPSYRLPRAYQSPPKTNNCSASGG